MIFCISTYEREAPLLALQAQKIPWSALSDYYLIQISTKVVDSDGIQKSVVIVMTMKMIRMDLMLTMMTTMIWQSEEGGRGDKLFSIILVSYLCTVLYYPSAVVYYPPFSVCIINHSVCTVVYYPSECVCVHTVCIIHHVKPDKAQRQDQIMVDYCRLLLYHYNVLVHL